MNTTTYSQEQVLITENQDDHTWTIAMNGQGLQGISFEDMKHLSWILATTIEDKLRDDELSECCSAEISETGRCMDCKEGVR